MSAVTVQAWQPARLEVACHAAATGRMVSADEDEAAFYEVAARSMVINSLRENLTL